MPDEERGPNASVAIMQPATSTRICARQEIGVIGVEVELGIFSVPVALGHHERKAGGGFPFDQAGELSGVRRRAQVNLGEGSHRGHAWLRRRAGNRVSALCVSYP
jgi:hypothetical protein